ncbi:MAG: DUF1345 domain-containing protein [Bacteroidota bacterium]|nr:DUF1345 domain-containing protein [Bacteroidota bacterium]
MPGEPANKGFNDVFLKMRLRHRILISLGLALLAFLVIFRGGSSWLVKAMIIWNAFAFSFILTSWMVFFTRSAIQMRQRAREEDGSRIVVFAIILVSCFACMFAVLMLILSKYVGDSPKIIYVPVAVLSMLFSWVVVHTTFCFHYTHLYYSDDPAEPHTHAGGLEFPREKKPDFLDFAYFSFVIGMTFQVSDVEITSRRIRRLALVHGLLSFGLNTFVVALVVNLIAGLKS